MVDQFDTHGPNARWTSEVDLEEKDQLIGPYGQIVPCSRSGKVLTKHVTAQPGRVTLQTRLQRELDTIGGLWGIVDMQREADVPFNCVTKAGSTTSAIKILEPVLPNLTAGFLVYLLDDIPRPTYVATSISGGDTVNIPAMSEAAPGANVAVVIRYPPKPRPNASDFPNPSFGFKIGANWFVIERDTGKIWRASLSSNVLSKVSSGSGACDLQLGAIAGNGNVTVTHKWRGLVDFTGATVTGLPAPTDPSSLGLNLDLWIPCSLENRPIRATGAGALAPEDATLSDGTDYAGHFVGSRMNDGADTHLHWSFVVPPNLDTGVKLTMHVGYSELDADTGDVDFEVVGERLTDGDGTNAGAAISGVAGSTNPGSGTADTYRTFDFGGALMVDPTGYAGGDLVTGSLRRDATGHDSFNGDIRVAWIAFKGKRLLT